MRLSLLPLAIALAAAAALPSQAAGPHQHGVGMAQLVLADSGFEIELTLPAADLVGFEHQPRNDGERAAVALAIALLEAPDNLFSPNQAAGCSGKLLAIDSPLLVADSAAVSQAQTAAAQTPATDHDHHHDHDQHDAGHDHDDHAHPADADHSDLLARYQFSCNDMSQLESIELRLFSSLKGLTQVELQWLSADTSGTTTLTPKQPRFTTP